MDDVERYCPELLWEIAQKVLPPAPIRPQGGGHQRRDARAVLAAIFYIAAAGCSWHHLPYAMFGVSRATAHRRFTEWTTAGVWPALHHELLNMMRAGDLLDWSRACVDSVTVRAVKGG